MPFATRITLALLVLLTADTASATTVTFIHYNDLHAHLTPHTDLVQKGGTAATATRGGVARIATLIKQIRASNGNSIAMNIGDTYHGGVEAQFTQGNAIVDPVNALGFDVGVPGNWDFAYGPDVTRLRFAELTPLERRALEARVGSIKRPNFPQLAANITFSAPAAKAGQPFLPGTLIKTVGGVKVGMIGISSDIVPLMDTALAAGLAFTTGEANYKTIIETNARDLRAQGCQIVVVMSELGIHKDYRLAQIIAKGLVDVFFSAHTHEAVFKPLKSDSGAFVVEAGNDGYVGRMDVTVDNTGKVTARKWKLLAVNTNIDDDAAMVALVANARAPFLVADPNLTAPGPVPQTLNQPIDRVVGNTLVPLSRRNALENAFNRIFTEGLRQKTQADFAIAPGFRFDAVAPSAGTLLEDNTVADGSVTLEDLYRFFPVAYSIAVGEVSGSRLKTVLEEGLGAVFSLDEFNQNGGWLEGFAGVNATVDLTRPDGQKVLRMTDVDNGAIIVDEATYRIAGCQRFNDDTQTLCGHGGFQNVALLTNPATGAAWTVMDMAVDLFSRGAVQAPAAALTNVANTALWPTAAYLQPLAENVTTKVNVGVSSLVYDSALQRYVGTVTVSNRSSAAIAGPIKVELYNLTAGVTLANASGVHNGTAFIRSSETLGIGGSVTVNVEFINPKGKTIRYKVKTYAGGL